VAEPRASDAMIATAEAGFGDALPTRFAVFPLPGAILLPGGNLPLNIFEPRYLHMTRDAMRTNRVIGMIQPAGGGCGEGEAASLFPIGCAGRITSFTETDDGRYLITLTGVCRYDVIEELEVATAYRQVVASFERWRGDFEPVPPPDDLRPGLLAAIRRYFEVNDISADWGQIDTAPLDGLVTSLAMVCPFEPCEKQALLEALDPERRAKVLIALLQMGSLGAAGEARKARH
jgi:Lon protease-like protein